MRAAFLRGSRNICVEPYSDALLRLWGHRQEPQMHDNSPIVQVKRVPARLTLLTSSAVTGPA